VKVYVLMAALAMGMSGAFIVGGEARFSSPSFTVPAQLVQALPFGSNVAWGTFFFCYAIALIYTLGRSGAIHVLRFGIALYLFLAISFGGSVVVDTKAAASGAITYIAIATLHLFLQDHLSSRGWERC